MGDGEGRHGGRRRTAWGRRKDDLKDGLKDMWVDFQLAVRCTSAQDTAHICTKLSGRMQGRGSISGIAACGGLAVARGRL
jgi:hypothetical protein